MEYFVELGGQTYGPANVALLQQWVHENRVLPDTIVRESSTGRTLAAREVPGLTFPSLQQPQQPQQPQHTYGDPMPPTGSPYDRPNQGTTDGNFSQPPNSNYYRPGYAPGGGPVGTPVNTTPTLIKALFSTLCCCCIGGLGAIMYVVRANTDNTYGRYAEAQQNLKIADTWANWAIGIGIILNIARIVIAVTTGEFD